MLEIQHLTKKYGDKCAVKDLSLTIEAGDIYGFIGHNGAGKTTTLKAAVGIMNFDEGDIFIDGHSIQEEPLVCKQLMAYLPDNPDLYDYLTGAQYLNFVCDVYHLDLETRQTKIKKYSELFDIVDVLGQPIQSYSHGMKQKLALIAALVHSPRLLVMDEPFVGLDPKASHVLKDIMKEIVLDGGAIFFSTHVLEVVEKLCNKVAIIKEGQLVVVGKCEDVIGDESLEDVFLDLVDKDA